MKIVLVSLFLSSFLFLYFVDIVEGDRQVDERLKALKSLIYNNADTTVKLDSKALKQLIQLSTTGDKQGDDRLKALTSLIYNNAEATVKLDSTALIKLIQLSTKGTFPNRKQRVSFSVYVKSKGLTLRDGQTAIYDGILTNDGNGYDDKTGVFTCPVAGTYMFVVDCLSPKPTWIHIVLNKKVVGSVHISTDNQGVSWQQLSRTVIVKARKGDHVKVANGGKHGVIHIGHYSGFSGTLLY
ncbi:complement C1q-like protein 2 isoform X1 [Ostrea edulis]|uniref:complement C1q-like protein 2 isoform X1 n=1 Tax=Ostrea edulis TaxID=37623 RepID=UPI0024AFB462|nr:complement C1q-like protein 2 isoform X1 [Ostrea edulis]